jgi:hypothetical protein
VKDRILIGGGGSFFFTTQPSLKKVSMPPASVPLALAPKPKPSEGSQPSEFVPKLPRGTAKAEPRVLTAPWHPHLQPPPGSRYYRAHVYAGAGTSGGPSGGGGGLASGTGSGVGTGIGIRMGGVGTMSRDTM